MATRKSTTPKIKPAPVNLFIRLSETSRAQLHFLLVERALTLPDEKPTISRLIAEAIGALARSKGWKQ